MKEFPREILVSPGYGAGWSTWGNPDEYQFSCEYQPIIEFLKSGGKFVELPYSSSRDSTQPWNDFEEPGASILKKFCHDLAEFKGEGNEAYFYMGGADDLVVVTVHAPYRVEEYDGFESVREKSDNDWIT